MVASKLQSRPSAKYRSNHAALNAVKYYTDVSEPIDMHSLPEICTVGLPIEHALSKNIDS